MPLRVGDKAPEFELYDQNGTPRKNTALKNKYLVLFFYPKDGTPGCTAEACSFRDNYLVFKKLNCEIWGVSGDNENSHREFAEINNLPFPLLIDHNNALRKLFSVPKTFGIIPGRVTFIIDKKGEIYNIFNNLLDGPAHVNEALRIVKAMQNNK